MVNLDGKSKFSLDSDTTPPPPPPPICNAGWYGSIAVSVQGLLKQQLFLHQSIQSTFSFKFRKPFDFLSQWSRSRILANPDAKFRIWQKISRNLRILLQSKMYSRNLMNFILRYFGPDDQQIGRQMILLDFGLKIDIHSNLDHNV